MNTTTQHFLAAQGRRIAILSMFVTVLVIAAQYATSHSGGMTGQTNKSGDGQGCTCHCANSNSNTTVTISTNATSFEAGQTYSFTISVSNGNEVKGGCDIAVQSGTLAAGADGLQLSGTQLTHTSPKTLPATWSFTYTAPSTAGTDTIFAAGNAVNNDGGNGGGNCTDQWNFASKFVINVTAPQRTLVLSRNSIAFGSRRVGGSYTDTMRISSTGNATVAISSQSMKTANPITNSVTGSANLSAGSSETQTITFAPTSRGSFTDTLVVASDANNNNLASPTRQTVTVTGTGVQAIFNGANTVNFGSVRVGATKSLTYSIANTGDDTLFLTAPSITGSNAGAFSITSQPTLTIPPGGNTSVGIQFAPLTKQQLTATLSLTASNGVSVPTITLGGTGTAPIVTILSMTDLGTGRVGGTRNGSIQISNGGDADLNISSITISNQAQGSKFSFTGSTAAVITPNNSTVFQMQYSPTSERTDSAIITINSDDITAPSFKATVIGEGGLPKMAPLQTDTIKFGDVRVGANAQNFSLQIKNNGTYDLVVNSIDVTPSQFTVVGKPSTVAPKGAGQVTLKFAPTAAGKVVGTIIVHGDDVNNPVDTVYVSGNGTISNFDIPSGISFGDQKLNTSKDTLIKLRNLGTAPVKILQYGLTDPSNGFQLFSDTAAVRQINPHDSATIKLRFNAFKEQSFSGTLSITTDEGSSSIRQIQLTGRGVNSKLTIGVSSLDFGTVDSATTLVKSFSITNTGTAPATINALTLTGSTEFAVDSPKTAFTIAAGGSTTVLVQFAPVSAGIADGTLTISSAEGSSPQVLLHGIGKGKVDTTQSGSVRVVAPQVGFVRVVPNPATTAATLSMGLVAPLSDVKISFYDAAARLVASQSVGSLDEGVQQIPLTLPAISGVSFVRITSSGMLVGTVEIVITR
ncbi:MAG: choice-of-anchor D domain-containing protein [Bacteroidetes bacterium]|nr:choice-of-anchor D domain-containing protein [Bacteroidota bacterium]